MVGKIIGGYYVLFDLGLNFYVYVVGGFVDDYEGICEVDVIMWVC